MQQASHELSTSTKGKGLYNITREIKLWVTQQKFSTGLLTIFIPHTSANYLHCSEGPDDMPAHIRSSLTQTQISIPVNSGSPSLGTWQDIYLFEHRRQSHTRKIHLHLIGE